MTERTPFIGGNWKMNTDRAGAIALARGAMDACAICTPLADIALFPPFPYLIDVKAALADSSMLLGSQDVYFEAEGPFTGEVSAAMLIDVGVDVVLTGHSERRHTIGESDELVHLKTRAGLDAGLWVVLCIGETLAQREAGETSEVILRQLRAGVEGVPIEQAQRQLIIAYEPVWAIGTGRNASPADAQTAHRAIRAELARLFDESTAAAVRVIYGGSVKSLNGADLCAPEDVDGFLVGGASLRAEEFAAITRCALDASSRKKAEGR